MSSVDPNTERRIARQQQQVQQQQQKKNGAAASASSTRPTYTPSNSADSSSSSSSSSLGWIGVAACAVAGGLFVRSLLHGTAPSSSSRYAKMVQTKAQQGVRQSQPYSAFNHQYSSSSSSSSYSSSSYSSSHFYSSAQEREAAYKQKFAKAQSDYARYEAFQEHARQSSANQKDVHPLSTAALFSSFRDYDPSFELSRDQARADYVQSKFSALRQSKRVKKYQTWKGGMNNEDEEDEEYDETNAGERSAWRRIRSQLMHQPRFIQARELLFGASSDSSTDPTSLSTLTSQSVRTAYFARAKDCHPDVPGGDSNLFQQMTDAYELLVETLEPIEKEQRKRMEAEQAQQQTQQQQTQQQQPQQKDDA